jgi:uncharacterized iron-regulated protein
MRLFCTLTFLSLTAACASSAHLVATTTNTTTSVTAVADDLAKADVVALGELHQTPGVHATHHMLLRELQKRRPDIVIAMEMFERDVQTVVLQYLGGMIDEGAFLAESRPWPSYARDYRPVVEFAKEHGFVVLAANAPRELATKVSKQGVESVKGSPFVARETSAPEDAYWEAFAEAMKEHAGTSGPGAMKLFYAAQCLKDDTMAESIVDHLKQRRAAGARPLVVLFCGRMHSDYGRGTVARIKSRMPELDIRVLSAETTDDVAAGHSRQPTLAEYVVVAQPGEKQPESPMPPAQAPFADAAKPTEPAEQKPAATAAEPPAAVNPEGQRPGLGFMPDYGFQGPEGVRVGSVPPGGSAEKAGIEEGDVILILNGIKVADLTSYTEALNAQIIGKTITVRVRRADAEVDLQVLVGARAH